MSLTSASLTSVVWKQYRYKFKSFVGVFMALIVVQALGIFISTLGNSLHGFSVGFNSINITPYSSSVVIVFTMIWAFMNAILVTTKAYREDDFTFVSNRLSYNLSNIAFLVTVCVIGALTALLSNGLTHILVYFTSDVDVFITLNQEIGVREYGIGLVTTELYVLLSGAAGYLVGMMVQLNKFLILLIPVILIGITFIVSSGNDGFVNILQFYFMENSFLIFIIKAIVTIMISYCVATLLSNRLEVRR